MQINFSKMPGYSLPTFAMWPQPWHETSSWKMYELKLCDDGELRWYPRLIIRDERVKADIYDSLEDAAEVAAEINKRLINNVDNLSMPDEAKLSLQLKVEKEVTCKSRLLYEEQLMLQEAIRRHQSSPRVDVDDLLLPTGLERYRNSLFEYLNDTPYARYANLPNSHIILIRNGQARWSETAQINSKNARFVYRDRIARGFGLHGGDNWGVVKAEIRKQLLPRANELLQRAGIKRMLDAAMAKGQRVLVVGNFVFWFEDSGEVGWTVLEASESDRSKKGNTLWKEGTIVSKNHGRIVVLPYIKENGERVQGHTKNAPNDGKAKPRHPSDYVELPFDVLEDDLMIGLFGEMKYE